MIRAAVVIFLAVMAVASAQSVVMDQDFNRYESLEAALSSTEACGKMLLLDGMFEMPLARGQGTFPCDSLRMRSWNAHRPAVLLGGAWQLNVSTLELRDLTLDGMYRDSPQFFMDGLSDSLIIDHCELNRFVTGKGPMLGLVLGQDATMQVTNCNFNEYCPAPLSRQELEDKLAMAVLTAYEIRQATAELLGGITSGVFGSRYPEPAASTLVLDELAKAAAIGHQAQ